MADAQGIKVYLVGGSVRDLILRRKNLDLDIVAEGDGARLAKILAEQLSARLTFHARFGTATLILPAGLRLDVATARREEYPCPGALPVVKPGTLRDDLLRRDFTINALAISLNKDTYGQLVDVCGGSEDLKQGNLRVLHDRSFRDDPTRILRAVRFEARFRFRLERHTLQLMKTAISQRMPDVVKPPRYFQEFKKILEEEDPRPCLKRLRHLKALEFLRPGLILDGQALSLFHRRWRSLPKRARPERNIEGWLLYFLKLLQSADEGETAKIVTRFHLNRKVQICLGQARQTGVFLNALGKIGLTRSAVYQLLKEMPEEAVLFLRLCASNTRTRQRIDGFLLEDRGIKLRIGGDDLKKLGVKAGPQMGKIMNALLYQRIDQGFRTKREELNCAKQLILHQEA